jgi:hypothetical protein
MQRFDVALCDEILRRVAVPEHGLGDAMDGFGLCGGIAPTRLRRTARL